MKLMNMKLLILGVASIMAMVATPVFAVSSASASLDNLTVSLISLNSIVTPAPTINWDSSNSNTVSVYAWDYANSSFPSSSLSGAGDLSAAISTAISQASASVINDGLGYPPFTNMSTSGSASGMGSQWGYFNANSYGSNNSFTLSADTFAIFNATASTNAQTTVGYDPVTGNNEYAAASAQLSTFGNNGNAYQNSSDSLNSNANYYTPTTDQKIGPLSVFFANISSSSATGYLSTYVQAYGGSTIAAVPEPSSWAMMLGGLGLIGFMTYRRRQYF
jgi:PEP-CTERM motif